MHGTIESDFVSSGGASSELAPFAAELRALAARALEPNVFYEPAFARRGRAGVRARRRRRPGVARGDAARGCSGFSRRGSSAAAMACRCRSLIGWTHPYGPLGTPLVDARVREAVIAAWLDHLAADPACRSSC